MEKDGQNQKLSIKENSSKNHNNKKIEVAQALNQEELDNLSSPDLEALSPDENILENQGAPVEAGQLNEQTILEESQVSQPINAEDLEGSFDNGGPQEGFEVSPAEVNNLEIDDFAPEDQIIQGAPSQSLQEAQIETGEENDIQTLTPEATDLGGEPSSGDTENLNDEENQEDLMQASIAPQEDIVNAGPFENSPDNVQTQEPVVAQLAPTEVLNEGLPEQSIVQVAVDDDVQESSLENFAQLTPEETQNEGNPTEEFIESQQIDLAQVFQAPAEEVFSGNPQEISSEASNNLQLAEASEATQLNPLDALTEGKPEEGISSEDAEESIDDIIAPEESLFAGNPLLQEPSLVIDDQERIELAEIEEVGPEEQSVQGYVNDLAKSVLEEKLEQGLSPQESAIAALQAGKEAAKEVSSSSNEMNELAFSLGENLIENINNQIENIQKKIKEKELQVAEAEPVAEDQVVPEEQEVAEAEPVAEDQVVPEEQEVAEAEPVAEDQVVPEEQEVAAVEPVEEFLAQTDLSQEVIPDQSFTSEQAIPGTSDFEITQNFEAGQATREIETIGDLGDDPSDEIAGEEDAVDDDAIDEFSDEETQDVEIAQNEQITPASDQDQAVTGQQLFVDSGSEILSSVATSNQVSSLGASVISSASGLGSQVSGFGTGTILSTSANLTSLTSLNSLNSLSSSLNTIGQAVFSNAEIISPIGLSSIDQEPIATDVDSAETYSETTDQEEISESYAEDDSYDNNQTNEDTSYDSDIVSPTIGDDILVGGLGETEFLYDFSTNVGGIDTLKDDGSNDTDRLFMKNIPEKNNILITKSSDDNTINLETFDTSTYYPYISQNVITTPLSNGTTGIEDLYLSTKDSYYTDTSTLELEDFYNFGSDSESALGLVQVGGSGDDYFYNNLSSYAFESDYSGTQLSNNPYTSKQLTNYAAFGKEGSDQFYYSQAYYNSEYYTNTAYVDLGEDADYLNLNAIPKKGSFFDGGISYETYDMGDGESYSYNHYDTIYNNLATSQHYGINSTNFSDAPIETNFSLLTEQGTNNNLNVSEVYFKNFENLYMGESNDTFYLNGSINDLSYIDGEEGDDSIFIDNDFQANDHLSIWAGSGNDSLTVDLDENSILNNNNNNNDYTVSFYAMGADGNDNLKLSYAENTSLESDIYITGDSGNDTIKIEALSSTNSNSTYVRGDFGEDEIIITGAINSDVTVRGDSTYSNNTYSDIFSFDKSISNPGLLIQDFETFSDKFEFSSAAFLGSEGHTLVFGEISGQQFSPDSSFNFTTNEIEISAYDQDNNPVNELTGIDNDYWHFDTSTSKLYYDEDADQDMSDAIEIATVQHTYYDDETYGHSYAEISNNLGETSFNSSDITYDDEGTAI